MLNKLNISNMAVIDSAELDVFKGFTVLTGETGAGKSVLIDSINMVLGHRSDKSLVRHGKKAAICQAEFSCLTSGTHQMLSDEGVFDFEDGISVLRSVSDEGRSVCKINGVAVSASFLKQLGSELVNIHGQQDNQKLLSKKYHTDILDSYLRANGEGDVIDEYKKAYEEYEIAKKAYDTAFERADSTQKEINYLQFVANELFEADISKGEEDELSERQEILANAMDIYMALSGVYDILYSGEVNVYEMISSAASAVSKVSGFSEKLREFKETLLDLTYQIKDLASDVCDFRDSSQPDEAALNGTNERLQLIFDLKRKYKKSADELEDFAKEIEDKLSSLAKEDINELKAKLDEAEKEASLKAERLTGEREKYKKILEKEIHASLEDLNMKSAKFEIFLSPTPLSKSGAETAEFMMCTAGAGKMMSMEKIASGGELSRIMLAIKYVLSDTEDCETLIFDEIDTGVSGVSATAVAEKLYALSKKKQVICITHLAQIAAMADNHVLIGKSKKEDDLFYTTATVLDENGRVSELSRIMTGGNESEKTMAAARELLKNADEKKLIVC